MVWLGMLTAWTMPASGAVPDRVVETYVEGSGSLDAIVMSSDALVATAMDNDGVLVLDTRTWVATRIDSADLDGCSPSSAVALPEAGDGGGHIVVIGCTEGMAVSWRWDGAAASELLDANGAAVSVEVSTDGGPVHGLVATGRVYAVSGDTLGGARFSLQDDGSLVRDTAYGSLSFVALGSFDQLAVRVQRDDLGLVPTSILLTDGSKVGRWAINDSGTTPTFAVPPATQATVNFSVTDLVAREAPAGQVGGADGYVLDDGRAQPLIQVTTEAGPAAYALIPGTPMGTLSAVGRMATEGTADLADAPWLLASDGGIDIYASDDLDGTPDTIADVGAVDDILEGPEGYVFAAGARGLSVLTARPWVRAITVSPSEVKPDTEVTVAFQSDLDGSYEVALGGNRTTGGTIVDSGSVTADTDVQATFTVPADQAEGRVDLWVRVKVGTDVGSRQGQLVVDADPTVVTLDADRISTTDGGFRVGFTALAGVDSYNIYYSRQAFTSSTYATAGPTDGGSPFKGSNLTTGDNAAEKTGIIWFDVSGLTVGTTYYVGVRAVDGGTEGAMSEVQSVLVETTESPCETLNRVQGDSPCAATDCGGGCSTQGSPGGRAALAMLGLFTLAWRRRGASALAALFAVGLFAAPAAHAQGRGLANSSIMANDITPAWGTFEFHAGAFNYADDLLVSAIGNNAPYLKIQAGVQIFRYAEIELGIGHVFAQGFEITSSGAQSGSKFSSQWLLMDMQLKARVHILDEQPIVPYAGVGLDWAIFYEKPLDADDVAIDGKTLTGQHFGWHWMVGGNILLDLLAPKRASSLEATTGINDTWLTIEYREQLINTSGQGLNLSGWSLIGGLKLDY